MNKHRMNQELSSFAARLRFATARQAQGNEFDELALELFALQFQHNPAYRKICEVRGLTPRVVEHWTQIPAVPTGAFKELELSCISPEERTAVFYSSGTTEQKPSRHFHNAESLAVYEASLWTWFVANLRFTIYDLRSENNSALRTPHSTIVLTPPPAQAPHSSLVHMFETVRKNLGGSSVPASRAAFLGTLAADGSWALDFEAVFATLKSSIVNRQSSILNPQSSIPILNPQSSILNPQSSILNPQSSIVNRQSSIHNPQSSIVNRQ
jgi:hypothetical protein